jgi:hypothetical protein
VADNVSITAGSGTNIATDDLSGVHYQRVKVTWGVDGTANDTTATAPLPAALTATATQDGVTWTYVNSAANTNATNVKASAGKVYHISATNVNASVRYLRLYNASSAPTVGTTTTFAKYAIPAGGGLTVNIPGGINFSTGIGLSLTTGAADSDTGAVAANEIFVNIGWK